MSDRWKTIEDLFHRARELDGLERRRFLAEACRGDAALRDEVESLLEQESALGFLDAPALEEAARALAEDVEPMEEGRQFGSYTIRSFIEKGGMGEVYRARDTKLDRDVAIKVLPESLAGDPERIARFQREAKILAALNHPNIAAIYGLEEAAGTRALVMELVEGPTLADRIARGAVPVDEALPIAKQIAVALEAAHEQGIIHRDLKPANIKLRPDGVVKVLDFGLAKALEPTGAMSRDLSQAPTITAAAVTQPGMILGTAAYMSPEQAHGKTVDKRADIWAFGCVLYEMLTGRRAFDAEDMSATLAAVLMKEPDWTALPPSTLPAVAAVLRRCLQKNPKQRIRDIGDVSLALEDAFETSATVEAASVTSPAPRWWSQPRWWLAWSASIAFAVLATTVAVRWTFPGAASPHYSRVTELLVVQAFSSVMTQMDAGVMTIEAMRRPVG